MQKKCDWRGVLNDRKSVYKQENNKINCEEKSATDAATEWLFRCLHGKFDPGQMDKNNLLSSDFVCLSEVRGKSK